MFGYLIASAPSLSEAETARYKASYCGLCRSLKARHGQLSRLTLNYDMTFLIILIESLYEPEETRGEDICISHMFEKRAWWRSEITDYAADMNVALSYLKCRDNWKDDGSFAALAEGAALQKAYREISGKYPRQCAAMENGIFGLSMLEAEHAEDADAASAAFGQIMGSVFVYREDRWQDVLYSLGDSLGRFIYLMDACMDLDSDARKGSYNPFRRYYGLDNEERFRAILKIFLSDAVRAFEVLPLVEDTAILKNILCSGIWAGFDRKYSGKKKGDTDGTGPV